MSIQSWFEGGSASRGGQRFLTHSEVAQRRAEHDELMAAAERRRRDPLRLPFMGRASHTTRGYRPGSVGFTPIPGGRPFAVGHP